jgi:hypothetical protein
MDSSTFLIANSTRGDGKEHELVLGNLHPQVSQKAAVDGNKISLTPSMIAIYFSEFLIFRLLYIGPSASPISESPTRHYLFESKKVDSSNNI